MFEIDEYLNLFNKEFDRNLQSLWCQILL